MLRFLDKKNVSNRRLLPLQTASVPFQVPFSKHFLTVEPLRTNPGSHSNVTISPLLYLLPYFRPLMGVPRTGQSDPERKIKYILKYLYLSIYVINCFRTFNITAHSPFFNVLVAALRKLGPNDSIVSYKKFVAPNLLPSWQVVREPLHSLLSKQVLSLEPCNSKPDWQENRTVLPTLK